jgi:hypothetical protein
MRQMLFYCDVSKILLLFSFLSPQPRVSHSITRLGLETSHMKMRLGLGLETGAYL